MARSSRNHGPFFGVAARGVLRLATAATVAGALGALACGGDTGDGRARSAPSSASPGPAAGGSAGAARVAPPVVRAELAGSVHLVLFAGVAAPAASSSGGARAASSSAPAASSSGGARAASSSAPAASSSGGARAASSSAPAASSSGGARAASSSAPAASSSGGARAASSSAPAASSSGGARAPSSAAPAGPAAPVTIDPALPPGLSIDPATGAIRGAARQPAPGRVHVLRDARGATSTAWVEILPPPSGADRFAAPTGDDANPGTFEQPFRTVGRAARDLAAGATLYLRGGVYRESVELRRLQGTKAEPITIRSYPGERAVIDASEAIFAESPRKAWRKATGPGAHPDEYESVQTFSTAGKDSSSRGAFLDRATYTRLLTYSQLEDLRAANQTWTTMPKQRAGGEDGRADRAGEEGPAAAPDEGDAADRADEEGGGGTTVARPGRLKGAPARERQTASADGEVAPPPAKGRPREELAPDEDGAAASSQADGEVAPARRGKRRRRALAASGAAAVGPRNDARPGPTTLAGKRRRTQPLHVPWTYFGPGVHFDRKTGRIHIRLSPTANRVAGLEEYAGPRDPRTLPLAISSRADRALGVFGCQHVRLADLGLFHGGDETVRIQGSADVVLDHVEIRAATYGLFLGGAERVRILHSVLDGGIPPWSFRSDFKGAYKFAGPDGEPITNNLVRKTQRALLFMANGNTDVEIAHSELMRGHDVYVAGTRTDFHHNRIHDIHDESLYLKSAEGETGMRIHENVIERTLSALSFWGKGSGERYVYRNLFDLRLPTAGHRPSGAPGDDPWRYGHPFKNTGNLGALYFYQNTVLVSRPRKPPFLQFSAFGKDPSQIQRRWFLNNLFAVVAPDESGGRAVAFIPPPAYQALRGPGDTPLLRSDGNLWVRVGGHDRPLFRCTENNRSPSCGPLKKVWKLADARGAAGFEAHSREAADPGFRRAARIDQPSPGDDLRPGPRSPALAQGIPLPPDLPDPQRPRADDRSSRPDAGALAAGQPLLRVGVDGRLAY